MKNEMTDEEMKQLFRKMRLEEEATCPAFKQVVPESVTAFHPIATIWRIAAAMAVIILFGAGTVMFLVSNPEKSSSGEQPCESWSTLSSWKAATDNMLTFTNTKINGKLTTFTDTLLEGVPEIGSINN